MTKLFSVFFENNSIFSPFSFLSSSTSWRAGWVILYNELQLEKSKFIRELALSKPFVVWIAFSGFPWL
jgi:hypothetical protein